MVDYLTIGTCVASVVGLICYTNYKLNKFVEAFQNAMSYSPDEIYTLQNKLFDERITRATEELEVLRNGGNVAEEMDGVKNLPHNVIREVYGRYTDSLEEVAE